MYSSHETGPKEQRHPGDGEGFGVDVENLGSRNNAETEQGHLEATHALGEIGVRNAVTLVGSDVYSRHERDTLSTPIDFFKQRAYERAEEAKGSTEFAGEKVNESIEGFYQDHEVALGTLDAIARTDELESVEELQKAYELASPESSIVADITKRAFELKKAGETTRFNAYMGVVLKYIYAEPCIGQLTLDDTDIDEIVARKVSIMQSLSPDNEISPHVGEAFLGSMKSAQHDASGEVRNAGQLLFHNTNFGEKLWQSGKLRGRKMQKNTQDKVYTSTATFDETHSSVPHFSELYDASSYKRGVAGSPTFYTAESSSMTVAIPLAEMIKRAPIARAIEYGVVQGKPGVKVKVNEVGLSGRTRGNIGSGGADAISSTPSTDRVFWAPGDSREDAESYELPVHGADIMVETSESHNLEPSVIFIQSTADQQYNVRKIMDGMKAEDLPRGMTPQQALHLRDTDPSLAASIFGGSIVGPNTGAGFGYPERIIIDDPVHDAYEASPTEETIRNLQSKSVKRYGNTFAVPLRAVSPERRDFSMSSNDTALSRYYGSSLKDELIYAMK